jgi:hypothetical protein
MGYVAGIVLLLIAAAMFWWAYPKPHKTLPAWWQNDTVQSWGVLLIMTISVIALALIGTELLG